MTTEADRANPVHTDGVPDALGDRWPELRVSEWSHTRDTLQLWTQMVGKVRMVNEPLVNHWWNVPLYVTSRGLTTSLISHPNGLGFEIEFDFLASKLEITTSSGEKRAMNLQAGPVASFYPQLMEFLDELGVS